MPRVQDFISALERIAPPALAEGWDNVGLLLGDRGRTVETVLTCLTLTPDVAEEAIRTGCGMVITHHPILFKAVKRLTADTTEGAMLLRLIESQTAVYSPHTGYDSASSGINQQLAERLELREIAPLRPIVRSDADANLEAADTVGGGRFGRLQAPESLGEWLDRVQHLLKIDSLQYVGDPDAGVDRVAIACGSAAEFLPDAIRKGCQALLTGEARFHSCLEARTEGIALVLPGHYATERFAMETLAETLRTLFPETRIDASREEADPVQWR